MVFLFLTCSINSYAFPGFDCQNARTNVENVICQNETLSDLDHALNVIYKKACALSPNNSQIKYEQRIWLENRDHQITISKPDELKYSLSYIYAERISKLLKDQNLRYYFLNKFINAPLKSDQVISILAILSLIDETFHKSDYNIIDEVITYPMIIPHKANSIIVALLTNTGAYRQGYTFFKIYKIDEKIKIEPFYLPQLKIFPLLDQIVDEKSSNYLIGNFELTKQNGKYLISWHDRPSSYEGGDSCIFQIDENGIKIVNEWYGCDFISVRKMSDLKKIAIKNIQRPTFVLINDTNIIYIYNVTCSYDKELKFKLNRVSISVAEAKQLGLNVNFPDVGKDAETKDIEKGPIDKLILKQIDR